MLPKDIKESLDRYAKDRCPTGGFLYAVLCNDLFSAMGKSDLYNRGKLYYICDYVYNHIPCSSWGSKEIVDTWLDERKRPNDESNPS